MTTEASPVVKCSICGCLCDGREAGNHKVLTGHNLWELLLPVECEMELSGVNNQNLGALDSSAIVEHTEDTEGA